MTKKNNGFVEVKKDYLLASSNDMIENAILINDYDNLSLKERIIDKTKGYIYNLEFEYDIINDVKELIFVKTSVLFPDDWHITTKDNVIVDLLGHDEEEKKKCYEIKCNSFDNLIDYISKTIDIFTELAYQEQALRNELEENLKVLEQKKKLLIEKI